MLLNWSIILGKNLGKEKNLAVARIDYAVKKMFQAKNIFIKLPYGPKFVIRKMMNEVVTIAKRSELVYKRIQVWYVQESNVTLKD